MPKSFYTHPDAVRLGAILQRLRLNRGWTLVKMGQRTGMNPVLSKIAGDVGSDTAKSA